MYIKLVAISMNCDAMDVDRWSEYEFTVWAL